MDKDPSEMTESEWEQQLSPEEYEILRESGTESRFSGQYHDNKQAGQYRCAGCGQLLFASESKFDSGTGWPSFFEPVEGEAVSEQSDRSHGMKRTEVTCSRCGGHLGHVFEDGPDPTGLRYCINSLALEFEGSDT